MMMNKTHTVLRLIQITIHDSVISYNKKYSISLISLISLISTNSIFKKHEAEKKREYNQRVMDIEHGTFTLLVFGTNGGFGLESQMFIKRLAENIAAKQQEDYAKVITWIRTRLSFEILRSALLCVRGSRRPWHRSCQSSDFGLLVSEAEIQAQ